MTTDAKQVPPALSAEEWERRIGDGVPSGSDWIDGRAFITGDGEVSVVYEGGATVWLESLPATIALANTALPDDSPYKVRPRDIEMLLDVARILLRSGAAHVDEAEQVLHIAGKLAALLPSE